MGLRFRQRIKLLPGVHVNWSLGGLSVSIGAPGATLNVNKNGRITGTVGIPGTGLSYSQTLNRTTRGAAEVEGLPHVQGNTERQQRSLDPGVYSSGMQPMGSASMDEMAKSGLADIQDLINETCRERRSLEDEIGELELAECAAAARNARARRWWRSLLWPAAAAETDAAAQAARSDLEEARGTLRDLGVQIQWTLPAELLRRHARFAAALLKAGRAGIIWHLVGKLAIDRVAARTLHDTVIDRRRCTIVTSMPAFFPGSSTDLLNAVPTLVSESGLRLHFFPAFLLAAQNDKYAVLDYRQVDLNVDEYRFIEPEWIPPDAQVTEHTWRYVNKDGSPDRRYHDNPSIPIVEYQRLRIAAPGGLDETFLMSSHAYEFAAFFSVREWLDEMAGRAELLADATPASWALRAEPDVSYVAHHWKGSEFAGFGIPHGRRQLWFSIAAKDAGIVLTPHCSVDLWIDDVLLGTYRGAPRDEFNCAFLLAEQDQVEATAHSIMSAGVLVLRITRHDEDNMAVAFALDNLPGLLGQALAKQLA